MKKSNLSNCKIVFECILIVLICFINSPVIAQVDTFYVATTGSDVAAGTLVAPWKTIQKAANTIKAGQIAYIREGTYKEKIAVKNSGYESKYITIEAYPNEKPVVDVNGLNIYYAMDLNKQSYVNITGIKFQNGTVGIGNGQSHIIIENNYFLNFTNPGISLGYCSVGKVTGNITDNVCSNSWGECITFAQCEYIDISYNEVKNSLTSTAGGEGIDVTASQHMRVFGNVVHDMLKLGIYIDSYSGLNYDIEIFNNTVYNAANGIVISSEMQNSLDKISIYNNLVYKVGSFGIAVVNWPTYPVNISYQISNVIIENNTISSTSIYIDAEQGSNFTIRNNILYNSTLDISRSPKFLMRENNLSNKGTLNSLGAGSILADPQFVNVAQNDFHLANTSPAIDKSVTNSVLFDHDLLKRTVGGSNDIGAFEYGASVASEIQPVSKPLSLEFKTKVSQSTDDASENTSTGVINLNSATINVNYTNDLNKNIAAIRFSNINLPRGAKIVNSYIRFYLTQSLPWHTYPVDIHTENIANSAELTTSPYDISNRNKSRSLASWIIASNSTSVGWHQTPALNNVISEMVSRADWKIGNAITFLAEYTANHSFVFNTFDGVKSNVPELVIEYMDADVNELYLSPTSSIVNLLSTLQMYCTDANATWSSSDPAIARIDGTGLVTGIKAGWVIVTVTSQDGLKSSTSNIRVVIKVSGLTLNVNSASMKIATTKQLYAYTVPSNATSKAVVWSTNDPAVASVNVSGLVTGVNGGTTIITATSVDGKKTAICTITVQSATGVQPIGSVSTKPFNIFPNPAQKILHIDFEVVNYNKIVVFDVVGNKVFQDDLQQALSTYTINLDGWNRGLYLINLQNNLGITKTKFVVQ